MKKLTTIALALTALTSTLLSVNLAYADSANTIAEIEQVKSLPAGAVPAGVKLASNQIFRAHIKDNPTSFNPQQVSDVISNIALSPIYDTLIRQSENGKYVPAGAESYKVSSDGLVWTFNLRKNAKWQDGKPVVASDYVYAFQRLTDPKTASQYGNYLAVAHVVNAQKINDGKLPTSALGVKALDDYTLQITLASPTPWLVQMLAYQVSIPLRKDLIEKYGDAWTSPENLVGNGPFKLTKYNVNDEIDYAKWDGYWNAPNIHLDGIKYYIIKNDNSAYVKFLSKDLDLTDVSSSIASKVKKELPEQVVTAPLKASGFIDFNNKEIPYPVRRAIALLVDEKFLTSKILKNNQPTSIFVPQYIQDAQGTTQADYYNQDIKTRRAEAIKLLDDAGYTPQNPFTLTMLYQNSNAANLSSNAFRAWLEKATKGRIIYKIDPQEPKTFYARSNDRKYQIRFAGWGADYDQASSFYNILRCGDPNNYGSYCNPEYDKLVDQANNTIDDAKRVALYQQANKIIQKDLPLVPLFIYTELFLRNPRLGGYNPEVYPNVVRDFYIKDLNK